MDNDAEQSRFPFITARLVKNNEKLEKLLKVSKESKLQKNKEINDLYDVFIDNKMINKNSMKYSVLKNIVTDKIQEKIKNIEKSCIKGKSEISNELDSSGSMRNLGRNTIKFNKLSKNSKGRNKKYVNQFSFNRPAFKPNYSNFISFTGDKNRTFLNFSESENTIATKNKDSETTHSQTKTNFYKVKKNISNVSLNNFNDSLEKKPRFSMKKSELIKTDNKNTNTTVARRSKLQSKPTYILIKENMKNIRKPEDMNKYLISRYSISQTNPIKNSRINFLLTNQLYTNERIESFDSDSSQDNFQQVNERYKEYIKKKNEDESVKFAQMIREISNPDYEEIEFRGGSENKHLIGNDFINKKNLSRLIRVRNILYTKRDKATEYLGTEDPDSFKLQMKENSSIISKALNKLGPPKFIKTKFNRETFKKIGNFGSKIDEKY